MFITLKNSLVNVEINVNSNNHARLDAVIAEAIAQGKLATGTTVDCVIAIDESFCENIPASLKAGLVVDAGSVIRVDAPIAQTRVTVTAAAANTPGASILETLCGAVGITTGTISLPGEAAAEGNTQGNQQTAQNVPANVTVVYGADISRFNVAIIPETTTLADVVLSQTALVRAGKTEDEMRNCKITINDTIGNMQSILKNGDVIRITDRVAGDKGAGKTVVFTDSDDVELRWNVDNSRNGITTIAAILDDPDFSRKAGTAVDPEDIVSINGVSNSNIVEHLITSWDVEDGASVTLSIPFDIAEEEAPAPESPDYICHICQGAGINPFTKTFRQGSMLKDIIFDPSVLFRLHQTEDDVRACNVKVNDVAVQSYNIELPNGASIRIEARVAGDKGND